MITTSPSYHLRRGMPSSQVPSRILIHLHQYQFHRRYYRVDPWRPLIYGHLRSLQLFRGQLLVRTTHLQFLHRSIYLERNLPIAVCSEYLVLPCHPDQLDLLTPLALIVVNVFQEGRVIVVHLYVIYRYG